MRGGLVLVSFGTSVPEARRAVTAVEDVLRRTAPDWEAVRAFTSPTIRRILAERGEQIPSLTEALERLHDEGVSQVVVQPTHLLYGYEYDKLRAEAERFSGCFETLSTGRPLLADNNDILCFAEKLAETHPAQEGAAVVYMGHGTEHFANAVYPALQTALHLAGRDDIYIGTVEGWPGLEDILRQLKTPSRVALLPLMLVAGDHARNDMDIDWRQRLEQAGHSVTCAFTGLGELAWVQKMYQDRLSETLSSIYSNKL